MRNQFALLLLALLVFSFSGLLTGCSEPTIDEEEAARFVEQWAPSVEEHLRTEAARSAGSEALKRRFSAARSHEESQATRDEPPFATLAFEVYEEREFALYLVDDEGLTAHGKAIWQALQELDEHRLDPAKYNVEAISGALERWAEQRGQISDFGDFSAQQRDREEAIAWLVEQPVSYFELSADNYAELTNILLTDDTRGARMRQALEDYQQKRSGLIEVSAELEQRLATALARYAREQRHFRIKEIFVHPRHWDLYNEPDLRKPGRRPDPERGAFLASQIWRDAAHLTERIAEENKVPLLHAKVQDTLRAVLDSEEPDAAVGAVPPQQPQYAGLVAEYRRYRDIVEAGGWEQVRRNDNLRPGQNSPIVGELKRRLQIEGYFPADAEIDDNYDDELTEAIRAYQETHQMAVTGRPHHIFWISLNISAERRLAQIGLNIERWRNTNVMHELETYTFVNIPDFHVEVWHNQERVTRHRTVVGDNNKSVNPLTGEEEYSNRTPIPMAAYIDRVIFNPYWNVTDRIRAVRILPEVRRSLESKYVMMLQRYYEQANEAAQERTRPRVAAAFGLTPRGDSESPSDESTEEAAPELSPEELEEKRRAERREQAFARFTEMRRVEVRVEGSDRMERRRFFKLDEIERLLTSLYGEDEEAKARFRARLIYMDWEAGEVDVENTNMNHVPSWYAENGYDVVRVGNWEYVRMLPGPENALGDVKIIFPNYDNIYLHDTPAKSLFNENVRGFSHGCIRIQDPLKLSEILLELGGREGVDIRRILSAGDYYPIFLQRQIPVFLEYYTVTVDDEGRANFLADIYGYDADALSGT